MELLAPAGSFDALRAAVQNGADAVYLGGKQFNARRSADNFTDIEQAVAYAHLRGCKVYFVLNTLVLDREFTDWAAQVAEAARAGVDAFILQDLGGARVVRQICPDVPIHASTQMTVTNTQAAQSMKRLGFSRVILARELTAAQIARVTREAAVETEVFVHGALCVCYSGQCLMSSMLGGRSANRGECAQPCRLSYDMGGRSGHLLSTKDICLANQMERLQSTGVSSLKIEGRMKKPEYVGTVTRVYRKALDGGTLTEADMETLKLAFNRGGFTEGMFSLAKNRLYAAHPGNLGIAPGTATEADIAASILQNKRKTPLYAKIELRPNEPPTLNVNTADGLSACTVSETAAQTAQNRAITEADVLKQLHKTGETPFYFDGVEVGLADNTAVPLSVLNALRREAIACISEKILDRQRREASAYAPPERGRKPDKPRIAVQAATAAQARAAAQHADILYIPIGADWAEEFIARGDIEAVGVYPQVVNDGQLDSLCECEERFSRLMMSGLLRTKKIKIADFGLNVFNSETLYALHELGFSRAALSPELNAAQINSLSIPHGMETEIFAYGRATLMITEHCPVDCGGKSCAVKAGGAFLTDRKGMRFPIIYEGPDCRVKLLNSLPVYTADIISTVRADVLRLVFTLETPAECADIAQKYRAALLGAPPETLRFKGEYTRGHINRGVGAHKNE